MLLLAVFSFLYLQHLLIRSQQQPDPILDTLADTKSVLTEATLRKIEQEVAHMPPRKGSTAAAGGGLMTSNPPDQQVDKLPKIAIIIDDLGYQLGAGKRSVFLQGSVTLAVLPFSPYASQLAQLALEQDKELMLHAPMEPESHPSWHGGLDTLMDEKAMRNELSLMLASLPTVSGMNNHMGSALTQRSEVMAWVMDELAQRGLYFIDSRTSPLSKAYEQAQLATLPSAKRDIFLDNERSESAIARQFDKLLSKARKAGSAIAIGHPYPETLLFLENALLTLEQSGVQLVPISELLTNPPSTQHRLSQEPTPNIEPAG